MFLFDLVTAVAKGAIAGMLTLVFGFIGLLLVSWLFL